MKDNVSMKTLLLVTVAPKLPDMWTGTASEEDAKKRIFPRADRKNIRSLKCVRLSGKAAHLKTRLMLCPFQLGLLVEFIFLLRGQKRF